MVNVVTKNGGNELRGSLRVDLSNPSWRDETPLEDRTGQRRESNRKEVLSATLGGPIRRDRLWFFLAGRDTEVSEPSIFAVTGAPRPNDFEDQRLEIKLTASPNERNTLQATYLDSDTATTQPTFDFSIDPRTIDTLLILADLLVLRWTAVLTPALFAEARYSRKSQGFREGGGTSRELVDSPFATLTQESAHYNAPAFDSVNDPEDRDNEQLAASLSYFLSTAAAGSHDLAVGFEQFTNTNRGGNSPSSTGWLFLADFLTDIEGNALLDDQGRLQPIFAPFGALALNFIPVRGAQMDIETRALYANDRWKLNEHWSFDLGFRYEEAAGDATGEVQTVDTDALVPRLAASYDPKGDGRYRLGAGYAEYSGRVSCAQFCVVTKVGFPDEVDYLYVGPPGAGLDFAPGFDLDNYFPIAAFLPTANTFLEPDLSTAVSREVTLSAGMQLANGHVEAVYTDRRLEDIVDDTLTRDNGQTVLDSPAGPVLLDNIVYRNSRLAERDYRALQVQGHYRITPDWTVDGHWTYQLENDGNFEGEAPNFPTAPSPLDNYPEILVAERSAPRGRLAGFQRHKLRLWTRYQLGFDRVGEMDLALLYRFDSARTYSLVAEFAPVTDTQLADDPGYAQPPAFQDVFFAPRGSESFDDAHVFDLAINYSIRARRSVRPWIKLEVRNFFNDQTKIAWDTTVFPDFGGPVDAHGIWTDFVRGPSFGEARSPTDFVTPREVLVSAGVRF